SDVWSITPTTVNEFRMGFTRQGNWFTPVTLGQGYPEKLGIKYSKADVFPNITIGGPVGGNNHLQPNTNAIYVENSFDPSDVVTMIRGRHILHFGFELLAFQDNSTPWGNVQSGQFTFSGVFTQRGPFDTTSTGGYPNARSGLGFADFLLGQVASWNANNSPLVGGRQKSPQFFIQDDFKLRPNLTLQLGLRYQIQGGWREVGHRQGSFDPNLINPRTNTPGAMWFAPNNGRDAAEATDYKIFLPRLGVSWSPRPGWAIRGGYGMYSYGWSLDTYAGSTMGFGANSVGNISNTDQVQPLFLLSDSNPPLNYVAASKDPGAYNNTGVNYTPYHTPVARVHQWSFSIQRQIGSSMAAEAAYVASHGSDLSFPTNLNQVPIDKLGQGQNARPFPQFQGISGNTYNARSNYNSLQLSLRKRFSSGLHFEGNYTRAKFLSDQDSSGWGSRDGGQVWQNAYNPKANYGYSNFDVPHALKGSVLYQVPFGRGKALFNHGLADAIVGGWQISSIFIVQSGQPVTAVVAGSNNSGALTGTWYPNVVGDPSVKNQSISRWFNPDAFAIPASFTFGNSGRNTLRGPGLTVFDLSMGKNFALDKLREGASIQFRFDAQNALNHASFARPNAEIGNTGAVGRITGTTVGGRRLQLGARFSF
ncbi:MAG TPA: TonB-dependent receptor, partial [Bryobacteraceae bacterium]|nr:TonB-dependent receptor [Bryobacteraceae bacterium]